MWVTRTDVPLLHLRRDIARKLVELDNAVIVEVGRAADPVNQEVREYAALHFLGFPANLAELRAEEHLHSLRIYSEHSFGEALRADILPAGRHLIPAGVDKNKLALEAAFRQHFLDAFELQVAAVDQIREHRAILGNDVVASAVREAVAAEIENNR